MVHGKNELCCGCTACEKICPYHAIEMQENAKGFPEPRIRPEACVHCGLCGSVCPLMRPEKEPAGKPVFLAAKASDEMRRESQSGGAFAVFAEEVLRRGGTVYGVVLNERLEAVYCRGTSQQDLKKMKGSKYVQAAVQDTYLQAAQDLKEDRWVLFSGTPCHIDGLKSYLEKRRVNTQKLLTADLICHGVPSPGVYRDYKTLLSENHGNKKIDGFNFRNKYFGWQGHNASVKFGNSEFVNNDFVRFFYSHLGLRDCCYQCRYANLDRPGDFTVGDCWGIEKNDPDFTDNQGISLILINSRKARQFWEQVQGSFVFKECDQEAVMQNNLYQPTEKPENVDQFWADYHRYGCEYALTRYCRMDPAKEYELITGKQYGKRILRKMKQLYGRFFRIAEQ